MRKVLFTESQLRKILESSPFASYVDTNSKGCEYPTEGMPENGGQISVDQPDVNGSKVDTDKIKLKPSLYGGYARGIRESVKKKELNESNQDLDKQCINFNNIQLQSLKKALYNNFDSKEEDGYDRIRNWIKSGKISYADAYRTLGDYKNSDYSENSILPKEIVTFIKSKLNSAKYLSKTKRNSSSGNSKLANKIQTPNAKQGTGKGHHDGEKLKDGFSTIHYY